MTFYFFSNPISVYLLKTLTPYQKLIQNYKYPHYEKFILVSLLKFCLLKLFSGFKLFLSNNVSTKYFYSQNKFFKQLWIVNVISQ